MDIRFFTQEDNELNGKAVAANAAGYISRSGKLILPLRAFEQVGFDPQVTRYRIGTKTGKRKVKTLYLVPTDEADPAAFELIASPKKYYMALSGLLRKYRLYYWAVHYKFTIQPFIYDGATAYALELKEVMTDDFKTDDDLDLGD